MNTQLLKISRFYRIFIVAAICFCGQIAAGQATQAWYIRRIPPEPWTWAFYLNSNITEMDGFFNCSATAWNSGYFDSVDVSLAFGPTSYFVFLEGGDDHAVPLANFLAANITTIENWVYNGGKLYIEAGPNYGGNIDCGFGGVVLNYSPTTLCADANVVAPAHPIFSGPLTPVGTAFNGSYYGQAMVTGPDISALVADDATGGVEIGELSWGSGKVIFAGTNVTSWQSPHEEAVNLRYNIFAYLSAPEYVPVFTTFYLDADGDNYGSSEDSVSCDDGTPVSPIFSCESSIPGYVTNNADCNDYNPLIYPGAPEIINGIDDNCDYFIDEAASMDPAPLTEIAVAPNPFTDAFVISSPLPATIFIYDALGNLVRQRNIRNDRTVIDASNLTAGLYVLVCVTDNRVENFRLIKKK